MTSILLVAGVEPSLWKVDEELFLAIADLNRCPDACCRVSHAMALNFPSSKGSREVVRVNVSPGHHHVVQLLPV